MPLPGERVDLGAPSAVPSERYRKFADSLLEGDGFEPSVPRTPNLLSSMTNAFLRRTR